MMASAISYSPGLRKVSIRVGDARHARSWLDPRGGTRLVARSSARPNWNPSPLGVSWSDGLRGGPGFSCKRDNKRVSICKFLHGCPVPGRSVALGALFPDGLNRKSSFYSILRDREEVTDNGSLAICLLFRRAYGHGRFPTGHRQSASVGTLFSEPKPWEAVRGHHCVRTLGVNQPLVWRSYPSAGSCWRQGTIRVGPAGVEVGSRRSSECCVRGSRTAIG